MMIDPHKVAAVKAACDKEAWKFAESGGGNGLVSVVYKPSQRHNSEQIFARIVRLWSAIDRPNAKICIVESSHSQGALRRTLTTNIRAEIIQANAVNDLLRM